MEVSALLACFEARAGGDFADGVIVMEGRMLGGETLLSFDKKAVKLAGEMGFETKSP